MQTQQHIASGRATLVADVVGRGDAVVFLHAAICDRRMWRAQVNKLRAQCTAIAYDRRGFGETRCEPESFSAVADLMTVIDTVTHGEPVILVGCSQGGRIAIDAALMHPNRIHALVLISPSAAGTPDPVYTPDIAATMARLKDVEVARDWDRVNTMKAHLFLDGPLAAEGRVSGEPRERFLKMHAAVLCAPLVGLNCDDLPAFDRLDQITMPTCVIQGELDFPHIQERSRYMAAMMVNGAYHALAGAAHLPSLERPADITSLITAFIHR
jgi:pimeloyl-ACP methyl ester carboxylesterase